MKRISILTLTILVLCVAFVVAQEPATPACDAETEEKNKALARRFYEKVWFSNNPEVVDEIVASEYVVHDIGDRKAVKETPKSQKEIAQFFWDNGEMSGNIDYQVAECDLVATRWQWKYKPGTWWFKLMGGSNQIPIINVFRFKDGKVVEIWNHRHDIDTGQGNIPFFQGLLVGLLPSSFFLVLSFVFWWRLRNT
ncbi:MAG: SnoaL-like domain-containing protein [Pyrinomonadaceae bacterium]|nr:SnoaL-like domain-containing protein [Pyrinomonadaceae bacterium]